ncbi:MAG TPA: rhomboid family intramembrane serine protease [Gemmatimonadaceae bacterium]|nr:rhomboid family intramembrane serine protease [Gemmatimonadaceae bacterium]
MTPWVLRILIANVVVFFVQWTMPLVEDYLAFVPRFALTRPWSLVTYMFLHSRGSFGHILFNMLSLYFFGSRLEARLGGQRFLQLYFVSGLTAAVISAVFAFNSPIIGASGAVYGVMYGFAHFWPRDRIYIWGVLPIEARWLVLLSIGLALFFIRTGGQSNVAHFAHLGGVAGGFLYLKWAQRRMEAPQREWRKRVAPPPPVIDQKRVARIDMSRVHEVNREELNRILDKISASGMQSLSSSEKTFLAHFAKEES